MWHPTGPKTGIRLSDTKLTLMILTLYIISACVSLVRQCWIKSLMENDFGETVNLCTTVRIIKLLYVRFSKKASYTHITSHRSKRTTWAKNLDQLRSYRNHIVHAWAKKETLRNDHYYPKLWWNWFIVRVSHRREQHDPLNNAENGSSHTNWKTCDACFSCTHVSSIYNSSR